MTTPWGLPDFDAHEEIHFVTDEKCGLRAIIAVHSTHLGPAAGGARFWHYAKDDEALTDALRLSRGMSYKNAMAGLPLGGGKSVILADESRTKSPDLLHAFGKAVGGLGSQILAGLRYAWADVGIRVTLIFVAVLDFVAGGVLNVGLPVLAHDRYAIGATGLGIALGAWGAGATLGAAGAGFIPAPTRFGLMLGAVAVWIGLGVAAIGVIPSIIPAAVVMALTGVSTGAINTYGVSWLQRRTDPSMQGRVISLVMTASLGTAPVAYAVSGAVAEWNATLLFVVGGLLIILVGIGTFVSRTARSL